MSRTYKKTLTIGFSKPRGFFKQPISWLIRKFEGSDYSHVYIKLSNATISNDVYYHASGSEVKFMGTDLFYKQNKPVEEHEFKLETTKYYQILDFAIEKVGHPFSIVQLVGLALVRIAAILGFKISNPFGNKGYVCTELVAELLRDIYGASIDKELNSITLKDIKILLQKNGLL